MILEPKVVPALRGTASDMLDVKGHAIRSIGPRQTVYEAIAAMTEHRVGALVVMDGDALVGILSERDYTRKVILQGRASKDTRVEEIMTSKVLTVGPETSLGACLQMVNEHSIRHLPVARGDHIVGVLSVGDLIRAVLEQQAETIQSLNSFIGADYPT